MCNFFSGIIVEKGKKVLWHPDIDSHTGLLEHFKLKDETNNPSFVRVEFSPADNDLFNHYLFNHDFSTWKFKTDQDFKPDWYDAEKAEELMLSAVKKMISERFVFGKLDEIKEGRWFLGKGADVHKLTGTAFVQAMRASSQVGYMSDSSQVGSMYNSSQVGSMYNSSKVGSMRDSSQVGSMYNSSKVGSMRDSSQVGYMSDSSQVGSMYNSSKVGSMRASSQVGSMYNSSQVGYMSDSSQVLKMSGQAMLIYPQQKKIVIADPEFKLEVFKDIKQEEPR